MEVDPVQAFHWAAEQGDIDYITYLLNSGFHVDTPDHDVNTALHTAAANDQENIIQLLLEKGAFIEATNTLGWTPLMQAARHGHLQIVSLLLKNGADLHKHNKLGMTALMLASVSGHMGTIRLLVESGSEFDPKSSTTNGQITPLMIAAQYGNDSVVRLYLDKGVNANKTIPKCGITPLMFSAAGGCLSTVQILMERGADPNIFNVCDLTAYDIAAACNRPDIANWLEKKTTRRKRGSGSFDIMDATKRGAIQEIREILTKDRSQSQAQTPEGATPLMVAAMMGRRQAAELLIQCGAHLDVQDYKNGWTALMQAIYHRQTEMAKFLIQKGANVCVVTPRGYTAFDFAGEMLDTDIMKILVETQVTSYSGNLSPYPHPAWNQKYGEGLPDSQKSRHGLKQWWNKVSNRFHKVKGLKTLRSPSLELDSINDFSLDVPLTPIYYDPILSEDMRLPPKMDFGCSSLPVTETMKSMIPPHISPTDGLLGSIPKSMPTGLKIMPGSGIKPPSHATNVHLLKNFKISSRLSFTGQSPYSSGDSKNFEILLKSKTINTSDHPRHSSEESDLLVSSLESGNSSLKTVTSSKTSKSVHSNSTIIPDGQKNTDIHLQPIVMQESPNLTISLGSGQLTEVLKKLSLETYLDLFNEEEVDLDAFLELSDSDLFDLGINTALDRSKIRSAIKSLKNKI